MIKTLKGGGINSGPLSAQDAAPDLVLLDGLEQGLKITLAETLIAFALDDLEEDRADDIRGKDLQQQALALQGGAVNQDAALSEGFKVFPVTGHAPVHAFIVAVGRILEHDIVSA